MAVTEFTVSWLAVQTVLLGCIGLSFPTQFMAVEMWQTVAVMMLTSFVLYPTIWYAPNFWMSIWGDKTGKRAVTAFSVCVALHKIGLGVTLWYFWIPSSFYDNFLSQDAFIAYLSEPKIMIAFAFF